MLAGNLEYDLDNFVRDLVLVELEIQTLRDPPVLGKHGGFHMLNIPVHSWTD